MYKHLYFDLLLHDDDELGILLSSPICQRETLQEWPLSCVQRLTIENGHRLIYKAQHAPTVEPEFYVRAHSSLLIPAQTVYRDEPYSAMVFDYIEAPTLEQSNLPESQVVELGWELLPRIAHIEGQLPYYLDISTAEKWQRYFRGILAELRGQVGERTFKHVQAHELAHAESWASSDPVLATFRSEIGLVHHDLAGDNIFMLSDGLRVIDWQRPILGPTHLDLALLLESFGYDPLPHVGEGIVWLMRLLRISWFTECALYWFPEGREGYDRQIVELIKHIGRG